MVTSGWPAKLFVVGSLLLLITSAIAECGGHGHLDGDVCVCDNSWPDAGHAGWVGESCQVPVFGGGDGEELTSACTSKGCDSLDNGAWICFTKTSEEWNFLSLFLNRTQGEGDPDLYGFAKNATSTPTFSPPENFTFQDTSSGAKPLVTRTIDRLDYDEGLFDEGAYICVHNYGPGSIKFSLKATMDLCPSSFARNGTSLLCHTQRNAPDAEKRYTECSAGGECVCKAPFEKPVLDVFPGLGFRDCGAEVVYIADDQASGQAPFVADSESVEADGWKFYAFNVTEDDFEVVATVAEKESSRVEIFAKVGAPPGAAAGQFDARSDWNPAMQRTHTIKLGGLEVASDVRTGLWFLGVYGAGGGGNFELGLAKYGCPGNCSSNGVCDDEQHKCACWDGYGGADCSIHSTRLEFNETVAVNTSAVFELEYYALPPVTDAMLQGNVEIIITAQFSSNRVNPHLDIRPSILLSLDGHGSYPTPTNFTQRLVLDMERPHKLILGVSQLEAGDWKLAVYNPMPSIPLNYTLAVVKVGRCLNDCSGNGECSSDGACQCHEGWLGGDCSVNQSGGGGKPAHRHGFATFMSSIFLMAVGAVAAFAYVSFQGIPRWLPLHNGAGFGGIGMYQELTEHEGI